MANFEYRDAPHPLGPFPAINVQEDVGPGFIDTMAASMFKIDRAGPATVASEQAFERWQGNVAMQSDALAAKERGGVAIKGAVMARISDRRPKLGDRILSHRDVAEYSGLSDYQIIGAYSNATLIRGALGALEEERIRAFEASNKSGLPPETFTSELIDA